MDVFVLKDSITGGMTDDEFFRFCAENPDLRIERKSNLEITIMSPTTSLGGKLNAEVLRQLSNWNVSTGKGEVFDSSAGFTLPDKSVFSPDASWMSNAAWAKLSEHDRNRFAPVCPEFVIEIRSKSDALPDRKNKMDAWLKNGALLAWLVDPYEKCVYVFRGDRPEQKLDGFNRKVIGEGPVEGFELDLTLLKA